MPVHGEFRDLLSGGDRRSIADSQRVRALIEQRPRASSEPGSPSAS